MTQLPQESSYSFGKGIWYVFRDKQNWIRLWLSSKNGTEKLYYNDELVHESKSLTKMKVDHSYTNVNGVIYNVKLRMSFMTGAGTGAICTLEKDNSMIGRVQLLQNKKFRKRARLGLCLLLPLIAMVVILRDLYSLPAGIMFIPIILAVIGTLILIKGKEPFMKIEDTSDFLD